MRKNLGFTLSEVLITLAIIGTVAALTLPGLMTNITNQQNATALAKAYNTLENANKLALVDNNARTLNNINGVGNNYLNVIRRYVVGTTIDAVPQYSQYTNRNTNVAVGNGYLSNDGIAYYTTAGISNVVGANNLSYCSGAYYEVAVDVNGPRKGPNVFGIDAFWFVVDTRGTVVPKGGTLEKDYMGLAATSYLTTCSRGAVTTGFDCAGSIMDNGWKVVYR